MGRIGFRVSVFCIVCSGMLLAPLHLLGDTEAKPTTDAAEESSNRAASPADGIKISPSVEPRERKKVPVGTEWEGKQTFKKSPKAKQKYKANAKVKVTSRDHRKIVFEYRIFDGKRSRGIEIAGELHPVDGQSHAWRITGEVTRFLPESNNKHFGGLSMIGLKWEGSIKQDGQSLRLLAKHPDGPQRWFEGATTPAPHAAGQGALNR